MPHPNPFLSGHARLRTWLFTLLLLPCLATALPDDRQQPIQIQADKAELDEKSGSAHYLGNVVLTQGSLRIEADSLRIETDKEGIRRLQASGKPAHYSQQVEEGSPRTHGFAHSIDYDLVSEQLTLSERARLERASDSFEGERIIIDTRHNRVVAEGDEHLGSGRVEMVIQPRSSTP